MRWGDRLEFCDEADPGDFIYVPPYVPHQEINARPDILCEAVIVRSGQDPIIVVPRDLAYGLARMFQMMTEETLPRFSAVRTMDEAIKALRAEGAQFEPLDEA